MGNDNTGASDTFHNLMATIPFGLIIITILIIIAVITFLAWKIESVQRFIANLLMPLRNVSPLFWSFLFFLITLVIWFYGGSRTLTPQGITIKNVLALITSEISIGFLVAWILIQFVDKPAKEEAMRDFSDKQAVLSQNIFRYLYGVDLPDKLFRLIEEKILKSFFYRKNYRAHYTFTQKLENGRYLIKVELQCDVYNITPTEREYHIIGGIERPHVADDGQSHPLGLTEMFINNEQVNKDDISKARDNIDNTDEDFLFEHLVSIPADGHINVKLILWMTKETRDYEMFRVLESSDSLELKMTFPTPLDVKASVIHPHKKCAYLKTNNKNSLWIEMNYPLTPHNGVLLWWDENSVRQNEVPESKKMKKKPTKISDKKTLQTKS